MHKIDYSGAHKHPDSIRVIYSGLLLVFVRSLGSEKKEVYIKRRNNYTLEMQPSCICNITIYIRVSNLDACRVQNPEFSIHSPESRTFRQSNHVTG